ncbi:uncharacterized protein [Rutidosis leptorrhynchoides]|uniref:uncharacterized protein n=1 Tax=Rutidosis leptorrhynchoides TaxID=125765 RepID=UPI003A99D4AB
MAKKKKIPMILLKIDFSKAYDSVSHAFLLTVLEKMGFGPKFTSWIQCCISNVNFSVLLNGSPSREGIMHRGLRQGNPLSSFLFIIVAEILSKFLSKDLANGILKGCPFGNGFSINHSQFTVDTIIFAQPSFHELNRIKLILEFFFFRLSGLQMNVVKTTLYGIHVSRADMISYSAIFDCKVGTFPLSYLGVPIGLNRKRIIMWDPIVSNLHSSQLSPIWKDLLNLQKEESLNPIVGPNVWRWKIGNGSSISFWFDSWANGTILKDEFPTLFFITRQQSAALNCFRIPTDLADAQSGWDLHLQHPLLRYDSFGADQLLQLIRPFKLNSAAHDYVLWNPGNEDPYSVATGVRLIMQSGTLISPAWPKVIWGNNVPSKIMLFHWLAFKKSIPVKDVLARRHILPPSLSTLCVWCSLNVETNDNL